MTERLIDEEFLEVMLEIDPNQPDEKLKEEMVNAVYQQIENGIPESEMKEILEMLTIEQLFEILFNWFD